MRTFTPVSLETLPGWARDLLAEARVARLGYVDEDDHPRVLPVTFAVAGGAVWSAIDDKPKRTRRARAPALPAAPARGRSARGRYDDDWTRLAWVQLLGTVEVLPVDSAPEAMEALARKYAAVRRAHAAGPAAAADRRAHASVALDRQPACRPLAPRAGIEPGGLEAGHLRGKEEHARGDARPAVGHQLTAGRRAGGLEARAQLLGREEAAARGELGEGRFAAPGMWPATGSIGSLLAAVALASAGVEQGRPASASSLGGSSSRALAHERSGSAAAVRAPAANGPPRAPAAQAAVEHGHPLVAEVAQEPPEAGRAALGGLVVGDDEGVGADAGPAGGRLERPPARAAGGARARRAPARARGRGP